MNKKFKYDSTLKISDWITCDIRLGIFKITDVKKRYYPNGSYTPTSEDTEGNYNPIFHFEKYYNNDGTPSRKTINSCDAFYCKRLNIDELIETFQESVTRLKHLKEIL